MELILWIMKTIKMTMTMTMKMMKMMKTMMILIEVSGCMYIT